ncbi:hypothetical protein CSV86_017600 [Pseudomonas putida CSV86]|uniref:Uncharacterized protein n=1 Tax=Pseudomonas bharatica CSV86 TaxID=1005395 RepID=L1LUG7_9PSED|nr:MULTISPECIES: hypothetical protein [Pseudomonas]MDG9881583.1 hypothetical protein [Pseudomonas sp. GD04058]NNJ16886.1 hypothetical protein [Pseudomonas bharatica CSV86]
MSCISYMGYTARVQYDARDKLFVGRILGVQTIISFHADSVSALHEAFIVALEDYLAGE